MKINTVVNLLSLGREDRVWPVLYHTPKCRQTPQTQSRSPRASTSDPNFPRTTIASSPDHPRAEDHRLVDVHAHRERTFPLVSEFVFAQPRRVEIRIRVLSRVAETRLNRPGHRYAMQNRVSVFSFYLKVFQKMLFRKVEFLKFNLSNKTKKRTL